MPLVDTATGEATQPRGPLRPVPEAGSYVPALTSRRSSVAHAALVSGAWSDRYSRRTVAECGAVLLGGRLGSLVFDAVASHHGFARTCRRCARLVSQREAT